MFALILGLDSCSAVSLKLIRCASDIIRIFLWPLTQSGRQMPEIWGSKKCEDVDSATQGGRQQALVRPSVSRVARPLRALCFVHVSQGIPRGQGLGTTQMAWLRPSKWRWSL